MKDDWKLVQKALGVAADGIPGPATLAAICKKLGIEAAHEAPSTAPSQSEVRSGKSIYGKAGDESYLCSIKPPYAMKYEGKLVATIRCHKLVAPALLRIFQRCLEHYGLEKIQELGLDDWCGCFNYRPVRGGSTLSMHAWGIAVDLSASENGNLMRAPQARLSHPDAAAFWDIVESEGAFSMGRVTGRDWMHFQFARI